MKHLMVMLIVMLISTTSQASTTHNGKEFFGQPIVTQSAVPVATRNVKVRVSVLKIPKVKILRSKPYHAASVNDWFYDEDDDVLITSYRRKDLTKLEPVKDLPEHVRWRLFLARQLALLKHKQLHS